MSHYKCVLNIEDPIFLQCGQKLPVFAIISLSLSSLGYDLSTTSSIPFSQDSVKTTEASSRISIGTNNFLLFPKQGLLDEGDTTSTQTAIIMITFIVLLTLIILSIFLCLSLGTIMKMRTRLQNYQVLVVGRSPDDDSCTARNSFTLNVQHDTTQQQ